MSHITSSPPEPAATDAMSGRVTQGTVRPQLDDLVRRAIEDHDALGKITYAAHITQLDAERFAAEALQGAVDDWRHDNGSSDDRIADATRAAALAEIEAAGWCARARRNRLHADWDMEHGITTGAARHEARRELGGE